MRLDNKLIAANITEQGDNIILCTNLQEAFFDVYSFDVQGETFIKKAIKVVDGCPVVMLNVELNGIEYQDVEFLLQQDGQENVFISEQSLLQGQHYIEPAPAPSYVDQLLESTQVLHEQQEQQPEFIAIAPRVDAQQLKQLARNDQQKKLKKTLRNIYEKLNYELKHDLQHAKQSMLQETLQVQQDVKQSIDSGIDATKKTLKQEFLQLSENLNKSAQLFTEQAIESFKEQVVDKCNALAEQANQVHLENLSFELKKSAVDAKASIQKSLEHKLNSKFEKILETARNNESELKQFVEQQLQTVQGLIHEQQMQLFEQSTIDLMRKQNNFIDEVVADKVNAAVDTASQQLTEHVDKLNAERLQTVEKQVDQVLQEHFATASQDQVLEEATQQTAIAKAIKGFKDQFNADVQNRINAMQTELYRKFAIYAESMGGGGGSVAQQFAEGGTMNGTLNVATGQILSGGTDLFNIFATAGGGSGGEPLFTSWAQTYSADYESTFTTVNTNSADWGYQGSDIKALTANWQNTYTDFSSQSANNASVYTQVNALSDSWDPQTLSFNESNAQLTISSGNTISLSALSGGGGGIATGAYLPLSGGTLTGDLNIQANITSVSAIQFDTTYAADAGVTIGQLAWNAAESTLDLGVNADVTLQLGQETIIQVKNTSGEIIRNGWAVYASGASGVGSGNITVSAYRGNFGGVNDLYLLGVATQEMADNDFGFVTTVGKVRDVIVSEVQESTDVSSWDVGTILYVSATERGRFTSVAPLPPNEILPIAMVVGENGTKRTFFIRAEHGYTLNELHNVYILSATDGQTITWDAANNYWKNTTPYSGSDIKALTGNWQSTYSTVGTNSASWSSAYTTINSQSAANASVYSTVNANSAVQWNYQGTDIKALTANWQNTYTDFSGQSANNASVYTTVQAYSAVWSDTAYLPLSGGTLTGAVSTNSDIEITDSTKGIILRSPNNTKYRITVTNAGELVTTPI